MELSHFQLNEKMRLARAIKINSLLAATGFNNRRLQPPRAEEFAM